MGNVASRLLATLPKEIAISAIVIYEIEITGFGLRDFLILLYCGAPACNS